MTPELEEHLLWRTVILLSAALLGAASSLAAAQSFKASKWQTEFTPYLWAAGLDGTARIGVIEDGISASFADIPKRFDYGLSTSHDAGKVRWGIQSDSSTTKHSNSDHIRGDGAATHIRPQYYSFSGAYRFTPGKTAVDVLGGVRYNSLQAQLDTATVSRLSSKSLWNPFVGARIELPMTERWTVSGYADYGGRSGVTDWLFMASVNYRFSDRIIGKFGYWRYNLDLDKNNVEYDTGTSGPFAGVGFRF